MKLYLLELSLVIRSLKNNFSLYQWLLFTLIILILSLQIIGIVQGIFLNATNVGILWASDSDAGKILFESLSINKVIKQNFATGVQYGVLYPRLGNLLSFFIPGYTAPENYNTLEIHEYSSHIALMLISFGSLLALSLLISKILFRDILYILGSTSIILSSFLGTKEWVNYIFRLHPDNLLSLLVALFIYFIFKFKVNNDKISFIILGLIASLALCTKQSFLLFLPLLLFIYVPPLTKTTLFKASNLYAHIAYFYFIIGFPQNFGVWWSFSFLLRQSEYSLPGNILSFTRWISQFTEQSALPVLAIIILCIISDRFNEKKSEKKSCRFLWLQLFLIWFLPYGYLLTKDIISGHSHYNLPHVSSGLVLVSLILINIKIKPIYNIRKWFQFNQVRPLVALSLLLLLVNSTVGIIPSTVSNTFKEVISGRVELQKTYTVISSLTTKSKKVITEASIPVPFYRGIFYGPYGLSVTLEEFYKIDPDTVLINSAALPALMDGEKLSSYFLTGRGNLQEIRKYYEIFYKKVNEAIDPRMIRWKLTYEDKNGIQVWQRI